MSGSVVSLGDVEQLCWRLSGWQVEQRDVDALLSAVTAYGEGASGLRPGLGGGTGEDTPCETPVSAPEPPAQAAEAVPACVESPQAVAGAQPGVQRIELHVRVSGSLTLHAADAARPVRSPGALRESTGRFAARPRTPLDQATGTRRCSKCTKTRPLDMFSRDAKGSGGYRYACRDCENKRKREAKQAKKQGAAA